MWVLTADHDGVADQLAARAGEAEPEGRIGMRSEGTPGDGSTTTADPAILETTSEHGASRVMAIAD